MRLPRFRHTAARAAALRAVAAVVVAMTVVLVGASGAAASTHTWIGPAGGVWSNPANWQEGAAPTSDEPGGTIVAFNSNATSTMDMIGLTINGLVFNGSNSTINAAGKTLSIDGSSVLTNIDSVGTGNSVGAGLTLQTVGNSSIFVRSRDGQLTINGPIAGNRPITFTTRSTSASGTGTTLKGSSTFTGAATVALGELVLDNLDNNVGFSGSSLQIGIGSAAGATVKLLQFDEIADSTDVRVLADGTLDVGGSVDQFHDLVVEGGLVTNLRTNSPGLTLGGKLDMTGGTIGAGGATQVDGDVTATSAASGPATINAPLQVGSGAFQIADGPNAVDLLLSKPIGQQSSGTSVTKSGAGTMKLAASTASTYTGGTSVADGRLVLEGTGAPLIPGTSLTVGDGSGAAASASVGTALSTDLPASTALTVRADGVAELGSNDSFSTLTTTGGTVSLGTHALTVNGAITMTGGSFTGTASATLVLGGNVSATSSSSAGAVIGVPVALTGARTFAVTPGAVQPELKLGGNISDGGGTGSITLDGGGTVLMQPPSGNRYSGPTTVNDGRLQINSPVTPSIPTGALTIGDGIGAPGSAVVEALVTADITAPTTINANGLLEMHQFGQNLPNLIINDGEAHIDGSPLFTNLLSMTGGAITGTGSLNIAPISVPPTMTLTSSAKGPARNALTGLTFINATTTMTVNAGVAPEFTVAGGMQVLGGAHLIKQGAGTAVVKGSFPQVGTLDVNAGTFIAEAQLFLTTTVAPGATLEPRKTFGTSTVNGTLRVAPGTSANAGLTFGPTGVLKVAVPSAIPAEAPTLNVNGAVTIASGATLDLSVASGVILQPGTVLKLITNDLADPITGQFANAPAGPFTEPSGHALSIAYTGGTRNDLEATVVAVPPTPTAPTTPTTPTKPETPGPTPSANPATLSRLRLAPKAFRAATSGGPIAAKKSSRSTTVRFTLDAASAVDFTLSRERAGIRSGANCIAPPKRKPAKAKRCTRLVAAGTFSTSAPAGDTTLLFTGRIGKRALATGNYVLAVRPAGGAESTTRFTILKPARR